MKRPSKRWQILLAVTLLLYACGYLTQFIGNYAVWQKNGGMPGGTSPPFSSLTPLACLKGMSGSLSDYGIISFKNARSFGSCSRP